MVNLGIIREVFKSRNGTNIIYDATYLGQPCYAIQHVPTGHIEVIDHNEQIIKAIIGRIARSTALVCDKRENKYTLKFHSANRERTITLRFFVYAKYKGLSLSRVRGKIFVQRMIAPLKITCWICVAAICTTLARLGHILKPVI